MKKYLMASVLVSLLLCCTGCGKKLTCTGKMMGMDAEVVTSFSGDKAKSVKMEFVMDLEDMGLTEDVSDEDLDEAVEGIKKQFESMDGYDDVKVTTKDKKITVSCSYDLGKDDEATSYDDTKKQFEDSGLTCK